MSWAGEAPLQFDMRRYNLDVKCPTDCPRAERANERTQVYF